MTDAQPTGDGAEPDEEPALEPGTLPVHPLRAQDVGALIPKEIG